MFLLLHVNARGANSICKAYMLIRNWKVRFHKANQKILKILSGHKYVCRYKREKTIENVYIEVTFCEHIKFGWFSRYTSGCVSTPTVFHISMRGSRMLHAGSARTASARLTRTEPSEHIQNRWNSNFDIGSQFISFAVLTKASDKSVQFFLRRFTSFQEGGAEIAT